MAGNSRPRASGSKPHCQGGGLRRATRPCGRYPRINTDVPGPGVSYSVLSWRRSRRNESECRPARKDVAKVPGTGRRLHQSGATPQHWQARRGWSQYAAGDDKADYGPGKAHARRLLFVGSRMISRRGVGRMPALSGAYPCSVSWAKKPGNRMMVESIDRKPSSPSLENDWLQTELLGKRRSQRIIVCPQRDHPAI